MLALIAAVPLETELLRPTLGHGEVCPCGPFDLLRGTLAGRDVGLLHCGIGKANAAAAAAVVLGRLRPRLVCSFGIGGAYPGSGLAVGDLALASEEVYGDEGVVTPTGFLDMETLGLPLLQDGDQRFYGRFPVHRPALQATEELLGGQACGPWSRLATGPFVTVSTCSGTTLAGHELVRRTGGICENMEGAAIAQVCSRFATPFMELRGISNLTEDRDLRRWDLRAGAATAQQALQRLLEAWRDDWILP